MAMSTATQTTSITPPNATADIPETVMRAAALLAVDRVKRAASRALVDMYDAHADAEDVVLFAVGARASETERQRFAASLRAMAALGGGESGVLGVRAMTPEGDAFVADRFEGSMHDLRAFRWPLRRKVDFMCKLVKAVDAVHDAGFVHGCLAPSNVLLDRDFHPILSEIGMVSVHASLGGDRDNVFGYGAYAAPELSSALPDARSDIYSLGRLFADLLLDADASTETTLPPELMGRGAREDVVAIVRRCATHSPAERFQDTKELLAALSSLTHLDAPATVRIEVKMPPAIAALRAPAASVGAVLALAALPLAWGIGCESASLRSTFAWALAIGVGLASLFLPRVSKRAAMTRVALAAGLAAAILVVDPLFFVHRAAALHRLAGADDARAMAARELVELGRDLRGARLAGLEMSGIDLRGADLRGADLSGARLARANLFGALLDGARMGGTHLERAALDGAWLERATDATSALCDAETHLPMGWRCVGGHLGEDAAP